MRSNIFPIQTFCLVSKLKAKFIKQIGRYIFKTKSKAFLMSAMEKMFHKAFAVIDEKTKDLLQQSKDT